MQNQIAKFINPLNSNNQDFLNNPYPELARLREEAPIYWSPEDKYWLVSKYADVQEVLRNPDFGKQIHTWKHAPSAFVTNLVPPLKTLRKTAANWLLNLNPPEHTRVRNLVNKAFTAKAVGDLVPAMEKLADTILEQLEEQLENTSTEIDLIRDFTEPFPLGVIALILGIPITDKARLRAWSNQVTGLIGGQRDLKTLIDAGNAMGSFAKYLKPHLDQRRSTPSDDLLSLLVAAEEEGSKLKTEELVGTAILLLIAGFETSVNLIGNAIFCLDRHPEAAAQFRADSTLADSIIRETLRFESPAQTAPRLANKDLIIRDQQIKEGDMVWLLLGGSNRDEEQFQHADEFDINRPTQKNLAFGDGMHRCVGASLANIEAALAIKALYARYPNIRLTAPVDFKAPFGLRGARKLRASIK